LQPRIIINDRNQLSEDFSTPEQTIPANALPGGRLWETCMTMNDTWGYSKNDHNWKPAEDLIRKLCDIASKGGNFLLNVGPTAEGTFPEEINERLARIGEWMKVNGDSIYGTTKSPFRRLSFDGRCTVKGRRIFLHVFHWPKEGLSIAGVQTPVLSARALRGNERLKVTVNKGANSASSRGGEMVTQISKPRQVDFAATVVELSFGAVPVVVDTPVLLKPDEEGVFALKAVDAEIHGNAARYEQGGGKDNIGYWTDPHDYVTWECRFPTEGAYRMEIVYACPAENAGSRFNVGLEGGPILSATVKSTGSWTEFQTMDLGDLSFSRGRQTLSVRVTEMPNGAVMNLQRIRLKPVGRR
ncbi:MAG: alpha-L-fucosidase, partial [Armatimonadetes bacterium]|nr:alpha-L-fucosidase [Armatimonadota bacterium]